MLETFRNAAQGWAAKVLLSLLVLAFGVWGITDVFNGISVSVARWTGYGPQDLATVGDVVISSSTYQEDLKQKLAQVQRQTGGNPLSLEDARKLGIDKQVFDLIINNAVLDATVEKMGLRISDKQIADPIASNPSFQTADGKFDPNLFRQALEQNGMNEATFFAEQRQATSRAYVMGLATSGQPVPKVLSEALLRYQNETRDGRYFTFSVSEKDVPAPTDEELKKQYESTPAAYTAPEYRSVAVMKVEPADVASRLSVTPEELQAGYDKNKLDFFKPEVRTIIQASFPNVEAAKAAKARVDAGEDLLKIAMEGGAKESDVTFADRTKGDFLDSKIGDAAFALAEGKVSDPVQGALNTVLLKALKVTPEHQPTLDEIKDALTKRLQLDKARDEIQSIYDAVEDARAQQTKFEDIASKAGIPFILVPAVSAAGQDKDGKDVNLPEKQQLLKSVFETDVGVENDALSANDGYIWYEVREVVPSALKPLDAVKAQVTADFTAKKLRSLASDKAKEIIAKAGSQTLEALAAASGNAPIKTVTGIKRADVSAEFDGEAALALFGSPEGSLTWSLVGDGKSANIIQVSKVTVPAFDPASDDAKKATADLKASITNDGAITFMKSLRADADVSINEPLWANIRGTSAEQ